MCLNYITTICQKSIFNEQHNYTVDVGIYTFFFLKRSLLFRKKMSFHNGPPGNDENFVASFHTFLVLLKTVKTTSWLCPKAILKEYLLQVINTKIVYLVQSISNLNLIHALLIIWIDSYGLLYIMFYKVIWIKCRVKY